MFSVRAALVQTHNVDIGEIRFADIIAALHVQRTGSVAGAARSLRTSPSQISKAVSRTERSIGVLLFARTPHGLVLTDAGARLLPHLEQVERTLDDLGQQHRPERPVKLAADPSIVATLLPAIASLTHLSRIRSIDVPSARMSRYAELGKLEIALSTERPASLPAHWTVDELGSIRFGLFSSTARADAFGARLVAAEELGNIGFVSLVWTAGDDVVVLDDKCPLPIAKRTRGHEAQTMLVALELAARSGQLLFAPAIVARGFVEAGRIREIGVLDWSVMAPLYLACDRSRVSGDVSRAIATALREALATHVEPSP